MKRSFLHPKKLLSCLLYGSLAASTLVLATGCEKEVTSVQNALAVTPIAKKLVNPLGLEIDKSGLVWVSQQGSGANDGKVSVINASGQLIDVLINLPSVGSPGGEPDGPSHIMFAYDSLFVLGTAGKMYKVAESALKPGVSTINASDLKVEDIGAFVLAYNFEHDTQDTHPYNFTLGPNNDMYITDAAANAIIRREKGGKLSVVTEVPNIPNPLPVGGPIVESVPTGIYYDGQHFYITTLLGFPFPAGKSLIYEMTLAASGPATITPYQTGFTSLVDIAKGTAANGKVVLEHGTFSLGIGGFVPNTGRLLWANGSSITPITEGLNQPAGLKQADEHTWYVTNYGDSTVLKITN